MASNFGLKRAGLVLGPLAELEGDLAFLVDAHRAPARVQLHAFGDCDFDLVRAGRHVAALLEGGQVHVLRALPQRRQGDVDGDVAAADDDDPRPDPHRFAAAHGVQEVDAAEHEGLMDAVDRDEARPLGAEAEEHGVVVLAEGLEAADRGAGVDRDAQHPDLVEFLIEQVGRQAVGRNAVAQLPAGFLQRLEDLDLVTVGAQVIGRREAGWTGADDADPLAGSGRDLGLRVTALGQAVLGRLGLQRPDEDGTVAAAAHAGRFARRRADQATGQRQRVVAPDDLDGGAIVAVTEVGDEARDVDVGRTRAVAGRRIALQAQPSGQDSRRTWLSHCCAVVAQGTAQRPGGRQPLRGELERHFVEGGEMAGIAAAEGDLGRQARGARQQRRAPAPLRLRQAANGDRAHGGSA